MTHKIILVLFIGMYCKRMSLFVIRFRHYPIVLGILWLQKYNLIVKFLANSLTFNFSFCTKHFLLTQAI